ncbi:MAG: hypothetical protein V4645_11525 [Pseudomonadota bacterium]
MIPKAYTPEELTAFALWAMGVQRAPGNAIDDLVKKWEAEAAQKKEIDRGN